MIVTERVGSSLNKVGMEATGVKAAAEAVGGDVKAAATTLTGAAIDKGIGYTLGTAATAVAGPEVGVPLGSAAEVASARLGVGDRLAGAGIDGAVVGAQNAAQQVGNDIYMRTIGPTLSRIEQQ
jgi:hypothetical protein